MLLFFHSYGCRASERVAAEGRIGPALNGELRMGRSGILRQLKAGMIPAVDGSAPCAGLINAMVGRGIAAMDIIQCIAIAALGDADMGFSMAMTFSARLVMAQNVAYIRTCRKKYGLF